MSQNRSSPGQLSSVPPTPAPRRSLRRSVSAPPNRPPTPVQIPGPTRRVRPSPQARPSNPQNSQPYRPVQNYYIPLPPRQTTVNNRNGPRLLSVPSRPNNPNYVPQNNVQRTSGRSFGEFVASMYVRSR